MFNFGHIEFEVLVRHPSGGLGRVCSTRTGWASDTAWEPLAVVGI